MENRRWGALVHKSVLPLAGSTMEQVEDFRQPMHVELQPWLHGLGIIRPTDHGHQRRDHDRGALQLTLPRKRAYADRSSARMQGGRR
jgi:hypothetical protein